MDVHCSVVCFMQTPPHRISSHLSQYLLLLTHSWLYAMRCCEMVQTAETKIAAARQKMIMSDLVNSADLESALASSPFDATWRMMVRISINPQLLRLIFIELTSEINGCFRARALWPRWTVCAPEGLKSKSLVPLLLGASWQKMMSCRREKGCSKY